MTIELRIEATEGPARVAVITTPRGRLETPTFMPVGTRGAVRTMAASDLEDLGVDAVLANTYHLMLRPGADRVAALGGLHRMMDWGGHIITDSGGYQVFSLDPAVDEDGVTFRSVYDGSTHRLTPEDAVRIQGSLGGDIQMALDICPPWPCESNRLREAVERTGRWAARAAATKRPDGQALFGIVQGGVEPSLRAEAVEAIVGVGFDGYGIGGLSVGEPRDLMMVGLEAATSALPTHSPRYLMGVGDPIGLVDAAALGVDLCDSVLPTRLGRHGSALTSEGRLNLRNARFAADDGALDPECRCLVCARWSRAYLRHLLAVGEATGARLVSLHNVAWTVALMARIRDAIRTRRLPALRSEIAEFWG